MRGPYLGCHRSEAAAGSATTTTSGMQELMKPQPVQRSGVESLPIDVPQKRQM